MNTEALVVLVLAAALFGLPMALRFFGKKPGESPDPKGNPPESGPKPQ